MQHLLSKNLKVCSIGKHGTTSHIDGTDDQRDIPLKDLANLLANSSFIIGPSTGTMHFATLCGCPQFVWTDPENNDNYINNWNPLKTRVVICNVGNWKPTIDTVIKLLQETFLNKCYNDSILK